MVYFLAKFLAHAASYMISLQAKSNSLLNQTVWLKEENMCVCVHVPMGILTFHRSFQARARLINLSLRNRAMNWIEITLLFWLAWFVKIYLKPFRLVSTRSSDCFLTRVTWYAAGCFLCCWLLVVPLAVIVLLATWWLVPAVGLLLQECQLYIFRCLRLLSMLFRCFVSLSEPIIFL